MGSVTTTKTFVSVHVKFFGYFYLTFRIPYVKLDYAQSKFRTTTNIINISNKS